MANFSIKRVLITVGAVILFSFFVSLTLMYFLIPRGQLDRHPPFNTKCCVDDFGESPPLTKLLN